MGVSRRSFLIGSGVLIAGAATVAAVVGANNPYLFYALITEEVSSNQMTAPQAHAAAMAKMVTLIDIRRPSEWAETGSGQGAHRLDLRRDDFAQALFLLTGGDKDAPIALICARGVRSARVANQLTQAGFTRIIDIPEGMLGSAAGPGWLGRGLPVSKDG